MRRLTKDLFSYQKYKRPNECTVLRYGQFFSDMYGFDEVEVTREQVEELIKGKVLYTTVCDEYAVLIRLAGDGNG